MVRPRKSHGTGETQTDIEQHIDERAKADNLSPERGSNVSGFAEDALFRFVERIERLAEEKAALADDMKEVFGEAKAHGFDTKIMRKVIARRNIDSATRREMDSMLNLYECAITKAYARVIERHEAGE